MKFDRAKIDIFNKKVVKSLIKEEKNETQNL
jgi:hypothetical protein